MNLTNHERVVYQRYADLALPRHTSYPAVPFWRPSGENDFFAALARSNRRGDDLSVYVHVPFCERLCYYCTCTKQILPKRDDGRWVEASGRYVERLGREIVHVARGVDTARTVRQLHFGGGTPTYLTSKQLAEIVSALHRQFEIAGDAEVSIELDPRVTSFDQLHGLRELGFNRVSLGVQDFDPRVQLAVNRIQPLDAVAEMVGHCRKLGFQSINFDLIYGLPFQTVTSVADTVRKTIALGADRVAFYRMAVIPELFRWQNVFRPDDLPDTDATCDMMLGAIKLFDSAGYSFVGLDHFAKPEEPLSRAHGQGSLRRTFQGMTTGGALDVIGFGPSAISILGDAFAQNEKPLDDWTAAIEAGRLATCRGLDLSGEDRLGAAVIGQIYCNAEIEKDAIECRFAISFDDHFARELARLAPLEADGLVNLTGDRVRITHPLGRLLLRVVAAVFDAYLPADAVRHGQSPLLASKVG